MEIILKKRIKKMKKQITLKEYNFIFIGEKDEGNNKAVKPKVFNQLEKFVLENENEYLKLTSKKGFGKILQAQNFVGLIQMKDGTTIEILPKIKNLENDTLKQILLKMLKTLKNYPFKTFNTANLQNSKMPLLEIFICMFLDEMDKLIKRGIKSDYISKEENLKFLKGKLKLNEQIKKNFIHKERFFVEYDEFLSDRIENRLIKTTLKFLYKLSKLNKNQQRIRKFLFVFDKVGISYNIKNDFKKVNLNRQMKDYEKVLLWSEIFLMGNSFTSYRGDNVAIALLFDMNLLFESYVGDYLKKCDDFEVSLQDKGKYLVESHKKFALKPDIFIKNKNIIADTKWKILSEEKSNNGISQADMYQLYAYGKKYHCNELYLIYPKDEENIKSEIYTFENEMKLKILFFDLENHRFVENIFLNR